MSPRAVLFDFDGVIADTENIHIAAWERTFVAMGWDVTPSVCVRAAEEDDQVFLTSLFLERGIEDGDVAGWVDRKQKITAAMLADSPRVYPGVFELAARLHGRSELGIVTTTCRANVEAVLLSAGLKELFPLIVAKEDVSRPKPDPEGYRLALKRLRLPASEAVALEDSITGLAAATEARVGVVAIGHRRNGKEWAGNAPYLESLVDLEAAVAAISVARAG